MRKLIIAGGGNADQSKLLDNYFLNLLKNTNKKIIYIPIALRNKISFDNCFGWIKKTFSPISDSIYMITDFKQLRQEEFLDYAAIYIGGGNTYSLLSEINNSAFKEFLSQFLEAGGIIYGGSAGAIILGDTIVTSTDKNDVGLTQFSGLGLIEGYAIWPHYNNSHDKSIKDFLKKYSLKVIAIPEESGTYIQEKSLRVIGLKPIALFSSEKKVLMPNTSLDI